MDQRQTDLVVIGGGAAGLMCAVQAASRGLDVTLLDPNEKLGRKLRILDYSEHALGEGSNAQAAAYIHLMDAESGFITYGVGVSSSTTRASIRAIFSALNRMERMKDNGTEE